MPCKLAPFPIACTHDTGEAQAILSREMASLRFQSASDSKDFRLTMNGLHLGKTMLGWNRFDTETEIEAGRIEDAVILTISVGPPTIPIIDNEPVKPQYGAVTSPGRHLRVYRAAGSEILILRASIDGVRRRLHEAIERRPDKPLVFKSSIDLSGGVGGEVWRLLNVTMNQICLDDSLLKYPLLRRSLDDLLLSALLSLPNSYSGMLGDLRKQEFAPRLVRTAEEFMEAQASQPIDLSDVASACSCSRRTLFAAFRRHRDYTPNQFLTRVRLELARELLQSPNSEDTVASIAHDCGFFHAGRFAMVYQERFGESPSQTLRRSSRDH